MPSGNPALDRLEAIYAFYDRFVAGTALACGTGCSACCTWNVTATSIEAGFLLAILEKEKRMRISGAVQGEAGPPWYRPTVTINEIAACCLARRDPPEDRGVHTAGRCLFLDGRGHCEVYARRPFACRAMVSRIRCTEDGEAVIDPFLVSVNLAIHQVIEDLDEGGKTGNLFDIIAALSSQDDTPWGGFPENRPLPGFLVEPAHRKDFVLFLEALRDGTGLGPFRVKR